MYFIIVQEFAIDTTNQPVKWKFRWTYVVLPVGFFLLSAIAAGIFYPQLPPEIVYHFNAGVPDRMMALSVFTAWMIIPQVFFMILAVALTRILMLGARYAPPGETPLNQLLPLMGNMVALPQIVLFIAMLQLFLYNAYDTGMIPIWIVAVVILILGTIVIVICFTRIIRRFRIKKVETGQEKINAR